MAIKKRQAGSKPPRTKKQMAATASSGSKGYELPEVELAESMSKPANDPSQLTIWLHGYGGTGKTTLTSQFAGPVHHLMFEPGAKFIKAYQKPVRNWLEFVAYKELLKQDRKFRTVTVDVADEAFTMCWDFVCEHLGIEHPGEEENFGRYWNAIYVEYVRQFRDLMNIPGKGTIFVSWTSESLFKSEFGNRVYVRPSIPSKPLNKLLGLVDVMGYLYYDEKSQLRMRIRTDGVIMAKTRPTENFLTTKGEQIVEIPMGSTPQEGYKNFLKAFNNELKSTGEEDDNEERKVARLRKKKVRR